jgi:hypothetical protein
MWLLLTVSNIGQMYNQVYEAMVHSNVAIKLDEAVQVNKDNNILQSKGETFSSQTQYYILHLEYLVFIDEGGDNTSQQNDGNAGGEKFIVDKDRCIIKSLLTKTATSWYLDSPSQMESPYAAQLFAHPK